MTSAKILEVITSAVIQAAKAANVPQRFATYRYANNTPRHRSILFNHRTQVQKRIAMSHQLTNCRIL